MTSVIDSQTIEQPVQPVQPVQPEQPVQPVQPVKLTDTVIVDQNIAFNVLIRFIDVAQKRGTYSLDESAKIFECIKQFQQN